jgi:hypothetical protein
MASCDVDSRSSWDLPLALDVDAVGKEREVKYRAIRISSALEYRCLCTQGRKGTITDQPEIEHIQNNF